ncbi:hypothetical protein SAMN05660226_00127 [Parapedobacter luteus]|uniref:Natural product n=1 Tax=Parapedobacter luteus TaxID=623280 RepID=A0A1T4ZV61_9SPHI|nr:hypothetical protein SAMN05660226_00127 [Parapedobacter luteus]
MNIVNLNFGEALTREQMKQVTGGLIWCQLTDGGSYPCSYSDQSDCVTDCGNVFGGECGGCFEVVPQ